MCTLSSGMAAIYWSHADWFAMLLPTCSMIYVGCHLVERAYIFCTTVQYFEQNDGGNLSSIDGSTTTNSIALLLNAKVLFPYINTRDLASRFSFCLLWSAWSFNCSRNLPALGLCSWYIVHTFWPFLPIHHPSPLRIWYLHSPYTKIRYSDSSWYFETALLNGTNQIVP